jgi:ATPase family associated with various cellular activities (AAA)
MDLKELITEALTSPSDSIAYFVSRELSRLYSDKTIIEGAFYSFDLIGCAGAELCSIVGGTTVFNKSRIEWAASGEGFIEEPENGWFNVLWQGSLLDVLFMTWTQEGTRLRHHWIIADTRVMAEDFLRAVCDWSTEVRAEILVFDGGYWYKDPELFDAIKSASFDNLILPAALKREIQDDFANFFASREVYERYRIPWKRGVLLIGPPGNGKTHTVKALINQTKQPCLYVKSFKSCWGTDHDRIRDVFARARKTTPSIVVLEDLDSLIDDGNRSFFLNELDGFAANTGVVVLATTNHPDKLDPAILDRPSRFDRKYYFDLPAPSERSAYIDSWNQSLEPRLRLSDLVLPKLVETTDCFSFAYLKELFLSSMMQWIAEGGKGRMDAVMLNRATVLREQMNSADGKKRKKGDGKKKAKKAAASRL